MIYIEVLHVKWEPGKLITGLPFKKREFEKYIAETYVELVKKKVQQQVYKSKWRPLSPRYLEYKRKRRWSLRTWEATGQLIKSLRVKKNNVVGFDNRFKHKESGKKLLTIAREMEYGTSKIPARPLFRLVYWDMRKNIRRYIEKYGRGVK